jgi:hypothetical protein
VLASNQTVTAARGAKLTAFVCSYRSEDHGVSIHLHAFSVEVITGSSTDLNASSGGRSPSSWWVATLAAPLPGKGTVYNDSMSTLQVGDRVPAQRVRVCSDSGLLLAVVTVFSVYIFIKYICNML